MRSRIKTKLQHSELRSEIKLCLLLIPILTLFVGVGLGAMIGASELLSTMSIILLTLKSIAIPALVIGFFIHQVFKKVDSLYFAKT